MNAARRAAMSSMRVMQASRAATARIAAVRAPMPGTIAGLRTTAAASGGGSHDEHHEHLMFEVSQ